MNKLTKCLITIIMLSMSTPIPSLSARRRRGHRRHSGVGMGVATGLFTGIALSSMAHRGSRNKRHLRADIDTLYRNQNILKDTIDSLRKRLLDLEDEIRRLKK